MDDRQNGDPPNDVPGTVRNVTTARIVLIMALFLGFMTVSGAVVTLTQPEGDRPWTVLLWSSLIMVGVVAIMGDRGPG